MGKVLNVCHDVTKPFTGEQISDDWLAICSRLGSSGKDLITVRNI